ncbi:MAG: hypothetical protein MHPDNHAH_01017 [Anaerolineales bacterium]|nr:hypothetical protein [Anaerolineales bacterium]
MADNLIQFFLTVLALSISMAGLASLISLFKTAAEFTLDEIFVFRSIILFSLCVGLAAILPLSLLVLMIDDDLVWMICSGLYALTASILLLRLILEARSGRWVIVYKWNAFAVMTLTALLVTWLITNAIVFKKPDAYVVGVIWGLVVIGIRLYLFLLTITDLRLKKKYRSKWLLYMRSENKKISYKRRF